MPVTINGTSGVVTPGATVGSITGILKATSGVVSQAVAGSDYGQLTLATAQTASGTAVDFTGIPSWAKRITVIFNGISTTGSSNILVRIGTLSGIESSGYASALGVVSSAGTALALSESTAFIISASTASSFLNGVIQIVKQSGNIWFYSGALYRGDGGTIISNTVSGGKTLSGDLDRLRITTVNGTDTFDAGTINISYE